MNYTIEIEIDGHNSTVWAYIYKYTPITLSITIKEEVTCIDDDDIPRKDGEIQKPLDVRIKEVIAAAIVYLNTHHQAGITKYDLSLYKTTPAYYHKPDKPQYRVIETEPNIFTVESL